MKESVGEKMKVVKSQEVAFMVNDQSQMGGGDVMDERMTCQLVGTDETGLMHTGNFKSVSKTFSEKL